MRKSNRALRLISLFNQEMVRATDETAFLQAACRIAVTQGGYRLAWIGFAEQNEAKSVRPVAQHGFDQGYLETVNITWADAERGRGPTGTAIRTGQPVVARNFATDPALGPWREAALKHGFTSSIALPLPGEGGCLGSLTMYAPEPDAFDAEETQLLGQLAGDLAYGIGALRHRAQRELAEAEARQTAREWQTTFDATNDAIWILDPDHRVLRSNKTAERLFHRPCREMLGQHCCQIVHGTTEPHPRCPLVRARQSGHRESMDLQDGERWLEVMVDPIFEAGGRYAGAVHIVSDITERKNLERQFLRSQRLEVLGALAGAIAHDLNNILAPIVMVVPLLKEDQPSARMASNLDLIQSSAQRATAIVRQLMAFGLVGQQVTLHLKHVLFDLCNLIRETFPKHITLACAEASNLWPLTADPTQLHQVLLNLCLNARDAMPQGGTLRIAAANLQVDDHFAAMVANARPGAFVHLQVSDTGTGIPPEHLDKIFEPFFTTKKEGHSTGLGLATVQRVVHGHRGFIQVRSRVGHGAIFHVYLPASPEAAAPAKAAWPALAPAGQGQLILVVDDEEHIRRVTQKTLLRHGYGVVTACDGAEAVALFTQRQGEIKAVITDLLMPTLDGVYLVRMLARMAPALPVVLSTGVATDPAQQEKLAELRQLGVSVFLNKPYSTEELLQAMSTVLPAAGTVEP